MLIENLPQQLQGKESQSEVENSNETKNGKNPKSLDEPQVQGFVHLANAGI